MHETTQVTYGDGTITVTMNSESANEAAAPNVRFGDYNEAAVSCFTEKELEEIFGGENANVNFEIVMSDEAKDEETHNQFLSAIPQPKEGEEAYREGVYFETEATKSVGDDNELPFNSFTKDVEMQFDIPVNLYTEMREYLAVTNVMGVCELNDDFDEDANTLTIMTHNVGTTLLLYRRDADERVDAEGSIRITSKHLISFGIIVLIVIWFVIDRIHKTQ